jgi:hypothetical protein
MTMRSLIATLLACSAAAAGTTTSFAGLAAYDTKIAADNGGALPHLAISATTLTFDTTNSEPFDFGVVSGSSTIEFILMGNPTDGGQDAYLAVGSNGTWNLRYEQWNDTGQLGFTHLGVADYLFTPPVPPGPSSQSPTELTHLTYRWDQATTTMELYLDGELAGINATATGFEMPTGAGLLGNNGGLTEGMLGVIERVTVYDDAIPAADILAHANAWLGSDMSDPFVLTAVSVLVNDATDEATVDLTWNSRSNIAYKIEFSSDLVKWEEIDDSYPTGGDSTSFSHLFPEASAITRRYYRVGEIPL